MYISTTEVKVLIEEYERLQKEGQQIHEIPMRNLVNAFVNKTYESFQQLMEIIQNLGDVARKRTFLNWIVESRGRAVRFLAIIRYLTREHTQVYMAINKYLTVQEESVTKAADGLYYMHQTLGNVTQPVYAVHEALDVMLTGTFPFLPTCLEFNRAKNENVDDNSNGLLEEDINYQLACRLPFLKIPKRVKHTINSGNFELEELNLWKAQITLRGDFEGDFKWVWVLKSLKILLRLLDRPDDEPIHPMQLVRLQNELQNMIIKCDNPFKEIDGVMHSICLSIALNMLHAHTMRLFLPDDIVMEDNLLKIRYWHNLPKEKNDEDNWINISIDTDRQGIAATTESEILDPDTNLKVLFDVDMSRLTAIDILEYIYASHSHYFLQHRVAKALLDEFDESRLSIARFGEFRLEIRLFTWLSVYLTIQKKSGFLLLTDFNAFETAQNFSKSDKGPCSSAVRTHILQAQQLIQQNGAEYASIFCNLRNSILLEVIKYYASISGLVLNPYGKISEEDILEDSSTHHQIFFYFPSLQSWNVLITIHKDEFSVSLIEFHRETVENVQIDRVRSRKDILWKSHQVSLSELLTSIEHVTNNSWRSIYETGLEIQLKELGVSFDRALDDANLKFVISHSSIPETLLRPNINAMSDVIVKLETGRGNDGVVSSTNKSFKAGNCRILCYCRLESSNERKRIFILKTAEISNCLSRFFLSIRNHLELELLETNLAGKLRMFDSAQISLNASNELRVESSLTGLIAEFKVSNSKGSPESLKIQSSLHIPSENSLLMFERDKLSAKMNSEDYSLRYIFQLDFVSNFLTTFAASQPHTCTFFPVPFYNRKFRLMFFKQHAIDIYVQTDLIYIVDSFNSQNQQTVQADTADHHQKVAASKDGSQRQPTLYTNSPSASSYLNEETPGMTLDTAAGDRDNTTSLMQPISQLSQMLQKIKVKLRTKAMECAHAKYCKKLTLVPMSSAIMIACEHPWTVEVIVPEVFRMLLINSWFKSISDQMKQHPSNLKYTVDAEKFAFSISGQVMSIWLCFDSDKFEWKVKLTPMSVHQRLSPDETHKLTTYLLNELTNINDINTMTKKLVQCALQPKDFIARVVSNESLS